MCGRRRGHNDFDAVPELGADTVRARGSQLAQLRRADAEAEIEALEELMKSIDPMDFATVVSIEDEIDGLASGRYRARVQPWDAADEVATRVGHENPIRWVRRTEQEVKRLKLRRRRGW